MKPLKVLSLFDGISCGMLALERANIPVEVYSTFEIEPNAIWISNKNYPNLDRHGDVFDADFTKFINYDLLIGGSPCTSFSYAKNHTAKLAKETNTNEGIGWELFMQYSKALHTIHPKYFLFENNYKISKNIINGITKELGVEPILIDAGLVSAQRRKRLYWTNIPNITQPKDKGLLVKDIIVNDPSLIKTFDDRIRNTMIVCENYIKYDLSGKGYYSQQDRLYYLDKKAPTVPRSRTETKFNVYLGDETYKKTCPIEIERLQTLPDNYTEGLPKTRRFEAIGNGWCVDVIVHILKFLPNITK